MRINPPLYTIDFNNGVNADNKIEFIYNTCTGKKALEALTLYCLKLLESVLLKQADFISITQEIGHAVMISSLDKLLMNINPRSGKPDHLVNISR